MATTSSKTADIPIIDISGSIPEVEVAKQLVDAATIYGFVYIKNEGKDIPVQVIEDAFTLVPYSFSEC
jgi:isopenicillin N synthase-like dioxygenase